MGTPDDVTDASGPAASAEPFMRCDDAAGSTYELAKLCFLGLTLAPLRLVLWLGLVLPMYGVCRLVYCLGLPLSWVRSIGRVMARLTLVLLGFWPCCGILRSGLNGRTPSQWAARAVLIVSNHVSWLDILFLMSESYSPSFVAKAGFLKAPMIGWFADTLFNCVSVDNSAEVAAAAAAVGKAAPSYDAVADGKSRGATAAIRARLEQLSAASRAPGAGEPPLAVFAEGTTSNGQYLINFRTGVFRAAAAAMARADDQISVPVHSMVLRYPHRHFSPAWESIFVMTHILRLLTQIRSTLHVDYLAPVELRDVLSPTDPSVGDAIAEDSAAELAAAMRQYMSTRAAMPTFDAGVAQKAAYHAWLGPRMMTLTARERLIYTHPPTAPRP